MPELEIQNLTDIREIIVSHWRVGYKVLDDKVHIVAVVDSRGNFEKVLWNRPLPL